MPDTDEFERGATIAVRGRRATADSREATVVSTPPFTIKLPSQPPGISGRVFEDGLLVEYDDGTFEVVDPDRIE
ncbi:MAG: hypothetical protein ABEJ28_09020 [Salinigranum sp.]